MSKASSDSKENAPETKNIETAKGYIIQELSVQQYPSQNQVPALAASESEKEEDKDIIKRIYSMYLDKSNLENESGESKEDLLQKKLGTLFKDSQNTNSQNNYHYPEDKESNSYTEKYNEFINERSWQNIELKNSPANNDILQSHIKNPEGHNIAFASFSTEEKNGHTIYKLKGLMTTKHHDSKTDVTIKMSMYDENGKNPGGLSIVVGIDKNGKSFISAPADIVIDKNTKLDDPVKIIRNGKEYFMPITNQQYEDLHNEMMYGNNKSQHKFKAISERVSKNTVANLTSNIQQKNHEINYNYVPNFGASNNQNQR